MVEISLKVNPDDVTLLRGALLPCKPSLNDILRATGGVIPAFAIRHCWKHLQHPKQLGTVPHGDTVPGFIIWTDRTLTHLGQKYFS